MSLQNTPPPQEEISMPEPTQSVLPRRRQDLRRGARPWWLLVAILTYVMGLASGYGIWGRQQSAGQAKSNPSAEYAALVEQINPKEGYILPVDFGDLGPQMMAAGVFDREQFIQVYQNANQPLTNDQMSMLDGTHSGPVVMNNENAYFLLNFLWGLGLSNNNPVLDSGAIQKSGQNGVEGFASTGGWTLATKPIREIFSTSKHFVLNAEQQKRLEEAAAAVYRPCCDNPTHFPDCNHGMAMLGLLELMASQNVSLGEMLEAAKYVNAFWYPQQTLEQAVYFQNTEGKAYQDVEANLILGFQYSSLSGFKQIHQLLETNGWLPQAPNGGGSCGV
jgi:hypothetical protein